MTKTSCQFASQLSADLSMLFLNLIRNAKKVCFPLLGLLYYFERITNFVVSSFLLTFRLFIETVYFY